MKTSSHQTKKEFWVYVRKAILWLIILVILATLADIARFAATVAVIPTIGKTGIAYDNPFSQTVVSARERILVIGDSTAVGIGAYIPKETIAGMLATDFPDADIINKAISGSRIADVRFQLDATEGDFDMIFMQAGANDVVFMTEPEDVERELSALMDSALIRSSRVVVVSSIDASILPLLPKIASLFLAERSAKIFPDIERVVTTKGGFFVDLYQSKEEEAFAENADTLFSADGFHPSSDGYRLAYARIRNDLITVGEVIEEDGRLYFVSKVSGVSGEETREKEHPTVNETSFEM